MKNFLTALLLLTAAAPAFCAGKFSADTREFGKRSGGYKASVEYAELGGAGPARFTLTDPAGKKVSVFETERAPFTVSLSGDGKRLIAFNGWWGQSVLISNMCVYASDGKLLGRHKISMIGPAGEDFSADNSVYAVGADQGEKGAVYVVSAADGRMLWTATFAEKLNGLKLSGDGKLVLIIFRSGEKRYRVGLYDLAGKRRWERTFDTRNNLFARSVNADGSSFELWEDRMLPKGTDGMYYDTVLLKRYFSSGAGGIAETKTVKVREEVK
jgi:hypothetical protein